MTTTSWHVENSSINQLPTFWVGLRLLFKSNRSFCLMHLAPLLEMQGSDDEDDTYDGAGELHVKSTGARVTLRQAIPALCLYTSKLPSDEYWLCSPRYGHDSEPRCMQVSMKSMARLTAAAF